MTELLTGHHSWLAYDISKEIFEQLLRGGYVKIEDEFHIRGIIQLKLEESRGGRQK